jgi:hypothetical protein
MLPDISVTQSTSRRGDFIAQDAARRRQRFEEFAGHVLLGARDPENASLEKIKGMGKVQIGFIKDDNLSGADGGQSSQERFASFPARCR